jgi:hypothetical protein
LARLRGEYQQPDAKDAKVVQKTLKIPKANPKDALRSTEAVSNFVFSFLRLLRNFCALCVRYFSFFSRAPVDPMTEEQIMANSIP